MQKGWTQVSLVGWSGSFRQVFVCFHVDSSAIYLWCESKQANHRMGDIRFQYDFKNLTTNKFTY